MFMEDGEVVGNLAPETGLGWGFSLPSFIPNPVSVIQQAVSVAKKVSPVAVVQRQIADTKKIVSKQVADTRRIRASQFAAMKDKQAKMMAIAGKLPGAQAIAAKMPGMQSAGGPSQADYDAQQQAAYDAQQQAAYDAQHPAPDGGYAPDQSELDTSLVTADTTPTDSSSLDVPGDYQYDPFNDNTGADNMQLSNIPGGRLLPSSTFNRSGMGDIWGDLMNTASGMYSQKTAASIQQSQAAQAQAQAAAAQAAAAATSSLTRPGSVSPVMLIGGAVVLGAVLFVMKKKKRG